MAPVVLYFPLVFDSSQGVSGHPVVWVWGRLIDGVLSHIEVSKDEFRVGDAGVSSLSVYSFPKFGLALSIDWGVDVED